MVVQLEAAATCCKPLPGDMGTLEWLKLFLGILVKGFAIAVTMELRQICVMRVAVISAIVCML